MSDSSSSSLRSFVCEARNWFIFSRESVSRFLEVYCFVRSVFGFWEVALDFRKYLGSSERRFGIMGRDLDDGNLSWILARSILC